MNNFILIGMPSCGKSTLGRLLAKELKYDFIDTDEVIIRRNGCPLRDILDARGVDGFVEVEEEAICFYKPFPVEKMGFRDLLRYMLEAVPLSSYLMLAAMMVLTTLVGLVFPKITHAIYNEVIPSQSMRLFWAVLIFSVTVQVGSLLIGMVKTLASEKVSTQMSVAVQSATMARVMSLPAAFFNQYSAGELATKIQQFHTLSGKPYRSAGRIPDIACAGNGQSAAIKGPGQGIAAGTAGRCGRNGNGCADGYDECHRQNQRAKAGLQ